VGDDWRTVTIEKLRSLILMAEPDIVEEAKWRKASNPDGVPTFSCAGLVCTLETYKDKVKLTFAHGASLDDSSGLFNASLDAGARGAIDVHEGDVLDESAFVELVREAVALNRSWRARTSRGEYSNAAGMTRPLSRRKDPHPRSFASQQIRQGRGARLGWHVRWRT
jgi:hypothetical protein